MARSDDSSASASPTEVVTAADQPATGGASTPVDEPTREMSPVLVTGLPRSGTSWVGKMLESSGELVYVNEPLNPRHPPGRSPGVLNATVTHYFQYICADNEPAWLDAFRKTVALRYGVVAELRRNRSPYDLARMVKYLSAFTIGRCRHRRALLDDPYALFSAAWFAERLGCRAIVLVRHPLGFVGSWRRLGWTVDPGELLDQPFLLRDLLEPHQDELEALRGGTSDLVETAAVLWRVAYAAVDQIRARASICVARYEDLAREPLEGFRRLYEFAGLSWNERVASRIGAATTRGQGSESGFRWSRDLSRTAFQPMDSRSTLESYRKRLTAEEIERVRELTADVAARFYDDDSFSLT